jgi:transposase
MRQKYRKWDPTFREETLALLARGDRSLNQLALDIGVPPSTLDHWYRAEMAKKARKKSHKRPAPSTALLARETTEDKVARLERENAALRAENDELKEDRAILKKAAVFFAKENE